MIQYAKKWVSLALAFVLVVTLLPIQQAQAAGASITIFNLYTANSIDATNDSNVVRETSNPIQVKATILNISDTDIANIYYEVTNITTGEVTSEKSNKATKTGSSEITFDSVDLSEGLNKVVLKLGDSSTSLVLSNPGWVYFTPSTSVTELKVNEADFVKDMIYPQVFDSGSTVVVISGRADNANEVTVYNEGMDSFEKSSSPDNDGIFYFQGDESVNNEYADSPNVIAMRGGDNYLKFKAFNDSNTYKTEKNFIYNNGKPFPYLTKLIKTSDTTIDDNDLIVRDLAAFDTENLTLQTKLKVDVVPNSSVTAATYAPKHRYVSVDLNTSEEFKFDLTAPVLNSSAVLTPSGGSYTLALAEANENYKVYDLTINVDHIPNLASKNKLTVRFTDPTSLYEDSYSDYSFKYQNSNSPLVTQVKRQSSDTALSENVLNVFNVLPENIVIDTNVHANDVILVIDDGAPKYGTIDGNKTGNQYTFKIEGLSEGDHKLVIQPLSVVQDPASAYSPGGVTFNVRISNSPFVLVKNIYTGLVLEGSDAIATFLTNGIQGSVENYQAGTGNSVKAYVNNFIIADSDPASTTPFPWIGTTKSFTLTLPIAPAQGSLQEGKNTIKFEIYNNGSLIREQSYEIYSFKKKTPYFESLAPVGKGTTFIQAQTEDKFATELSKVTFEGYVYNTTSVTVNKYYKDKNEDKTDTVGGVALGTPDSQGKRTITLADIPLTQFRSDVRFEFIATNTDNLTATQSITIVREPVAYRIVSPETFKNEKGLVQANVNGNFAEITIEADDADSVLFGKETAEQQDLPNDNWYKYTLTGLKPGANTVKFTVMRGSEKTEGSFILYNVNTDEVGAAYLLPLASKMKVFDGQLELGFPKGTLLERLDPNSENNTFLTASRKILFGIADSNDGRVNMNESSRSIAESRLTNTTVVNRFSPVSRLFWIDGGVIKDIQSSSTEDERNKYRQDALAGRGLDPYDTKNFFFSSRDAEEQVVPSSGGELTLKFDPNIRYDAWKYLTVFHFSIDKGVTGGDSISWKNIGGVVDMKNNTITVPIEKFGYYQVMHMDKSYDDVSNHQYAKDSMDILFSKGIMNGKTDYTFSTTEPITRGEFAEMLVKTFDIPLNYDGDSTFVDVPKTTRTTLYEYKYIETASRAGIIRGTSQNRFEPNRSIARQDAAVMIARAGELKVQSDANKAKASVIKTFTDGSSIDLYSAPAVEAVVKAGFIEGIANVLTDGQKKQTVRFDPTQNFSRADASIVAIRVLTQQKKIPK